jgi:hypothetical protein
MGASYILTSTGKGDRLVAGLIDTWLTISDVAGAIERGAIREETLQGSLGDIVASWRVGSVHDAEITEALGHSRRESIVTPISFSPF